jgi:hypothetical protein
MEELGLGRRKVDLAVGRCCHHSGGDGIGGDGWAGGSDISKLLGNKYRTRKDLDIIRLRYHTVLNRKIKISYTLKLLT